MLVSKLRNPLKFDSCHRTKEISPAKPITVPKFYDLTQQTAINNGHPSIELYSESEDSCDFSIPIHSIIKRKTSLGVLDGIQTINEDRLQELMNNLLGKIIVYSFRSQTPKIYHLTTGPVVAAKLSNGNTRYWGILADDKKPILTLGGISEDRYRHVNNSTALMSTEFKTELVVGDLSEHKGHLTYHRKGNNAHLYLSGSNPSPILKNLEQTLLL